MHIYMHVSYICICMYYIHIHIYIAYIHTSKMVIQMSNSTPCNLVFPVAALPATYCKIISFSSQDHIDFMMNILIYIYITHIHILT